MVTAIVSFMLALAPSSPERRDLSPCIVPMRPLRVLAAGHLVIIVLIVLVVFVMLIVLIVTMIVLVAIVIGISRVDVGCSRRFRCTFLIRSVVPSRLGKRRPLARS